MGMPRNVPKTNQSFNPDSRFIRSLMSSVTIFFSVWASNNFKLNFGKSKNLGYYYTCKSVSHAGAMQNVMLLLRASGVIVFSV